MKLLKKVISLITEPRIPYFFEYRYKLFLNISKFVQIKLIYILLAKKKINKPTIVVWLGFHGNTGGGIAVSSIITMLARNFNVSVVTFPQSCMNRRLSHSVNLIKKITDEADLFLVDSELETESYEYLKQFKKPVLLTCHCFPDRAHGLSPERVMLAVNKADIVHFVSECQRNEFNLPSNKTVVIPNTNDRIVKNNFGKNIGIIGNVNQISKNINDAIKLSIKSNAERINVWGSQGMSANPDKRVFVHAWCNDKTKIYNSIDILVSLSSFETFGLIVIEAMSAGIPCVLSDIPGFHAFKDCPGIFLFEKNDPAAIKKLNELLESGNKYKNTLINYWKEHFEKEIVEAEWVELVTAINSKKINLKTT